MLLSEVTTLRLGGPACEVVEADSTETLVAAVDDADRAGIPVLLVGGGSNLVVADEGFDGRVVLVRSTGVRSESDACSGATVTVAAGHDWDDLVGLAVESGWVGIEALSGIPGSVGATPLQNVGAYGQEVSSTITSVRAWDRHARAHRTIPAADCGFGYRTSRFKTDPGRFVIYEVMFQFPLGELGSPVAYAELADRLGVASGQRAPASEVRGAVLELRAGKGMVLDPTDHDTWSAGSFFTNPVLDARAAERLPVGAPRFPQPDGTVKTSAAWLISHTGFRKGHGRGNVALSTKHVLALTHRGGGSTRELLDLAGEVRARVEAAHGIRLVPEPNLIGCTLP